MTKRIGVYPGTFDPVTLGHLDVVRRSLNVVDKLILGVAESDNKSPLFSEDERVLLLHQSIEELGLDSSKIKVVPFGNLLADFVYEQNATLIIRGLRAVSDFDYEFQMAGMNRHIAPDIETLFLMAADKYQLIASRFVREVARLGGDVSPFVTKIVHKALIDKFHQ
ncbi:MAG: pantetheine-phosphate adenylyltransferase [Alphaproteobacteria bacterium]